jgi:hypothetical protein
VWLFLQRYCNGQHIVGGGVVPHTTTTTTITTVISSCHQRIINVSSSMYHPLVPWTTCFPYFAFGIANSLDDFYL